MNAFGTAISAIATLQVTDDTTGPYMISAIARPDRSSIVVTWSEPIVPGESAAGYQILDPEGNNIIDYNRAELDTNGRNLTLFMVDTWRPGMTYRVRNEGGTPDYCGTPDFSTNHTIFIDPELTITSDPSTGRLTVRWVTPGQLEESSNLIDWSNSSRQNGVAGPPTGASRFFRVQR